MKTQNNPSEIAKSNQLTNQEGRYDLSTEVTSIPIDIFDLRDKYIEALFGEFQEMGCIVMPSTARKFKTSILRVLEYVYCYKGGDLSNLRLYMIEYVMNLKKWQKKLRNGESFYTKGMNKSTGEIIDDIAFNLLSDQAVSCRCFGLGKKMSVNRKTFTRDKVTFLDDFVKKWNFGKVIFKKRKPTCPIMFAYHEYLTKTCITKGTKKTMIQKVYAVDYLYKYMKNHNPLTHNEPSILNKLTDPVFCEGYFNYHAVWTEDDTGFTESRRGKKKSFKTKHTVTGYIVDYIDFCIMYANNEKNRILDLLVVSNIDGDTTHDSKDLVIQKHKRERIIEMLTDSKEHLRRLALAYTGNELEKEEHKIKSCGYVVDEIPFPEVFFKAMMYGLMLDPSITTLTSEILDVKNINDDEPEKSKYYNYPEHWNNGTQIESLNVRERAVLALGYLGGFRVESVAHLKVKHIDLENREVTFTHYKDTSIKSNSQKPRVYQIYSDELFNILKRVCKNLSPDEYLWYSTTKNREGGLSKVFCRRLISYNMKKAIVPTLDSRYDSKVYEVSYHSLRRAFAHNEINIARKMVALDFKDRFKESFNQTGSVESVNMEELYKDMLNPLDLVATKMGHADSTTTKLEYLEMDNLQTIIDKRDKESQLRKVVVESSLNIDFASKSRHVADSQRIEEI